MNQFCKRGAAFLLTAVLTLSGLPAVSAAAETVPAGAISAVTANGATTFYYDTAVSGGMEAMWDDAVSATKSTVKLYSDWNSQNGTKLVNDGKGAAYEGAICIPSGHEVTLDLNGFTINRGLEAPIENGAVIYIENGATLNLTDTRAASGGDGKITGGNSTTGAGGIQIEMGGSLNLWGGWITGNTTAETGGGIFLNGEGSMVYMTGGKISDNHADGNGGGIAMANGSLEVVSGAITQNTSGASGGGIFQQGGSVLFQAGDVSSNSAIKGGGICTIQDASLTLRGETTIQNNVAGTVGEQGRGGGILAMSSLPVQLSGKPKVISNRQSDGIISNLTFWVSDTGTFVGPRILDQGVESGAQVGLNFFGGEERELAFAPTWGEKSVFVADGAFEYFDVDGIQYLKRPIELEDYIVWVWVGAGAAVVLILVVGILVIIAIQKQKKRRRKRGKKRRRAAGSSQAHPQSARRTKS